MAGKEGVGRWGLLLNKHRAAVINDLNVTQILPELMKRRIFSYTEERKILMPIDPRHRAELLIDLLEDKSEQCIHDFCSVLQHTNPRLATSFALDSQGRLDSSLFLVKRNALVTSRWHVIDRTRNSRGRCSRIIPPYFIKLWMSLTLYCNYKLIIGLIQVIVYCCKYKPV